MLIFTFLSKFEEACKHHFNTFMFYAKQQQLGWQKHNK